MAERRTTINESNGSTKAVYGRDNYLVDNVATPDIHAYVYAALQCVRGRRNVTGKDAVCTVNTS